MSNESIEAKYKKLKEAYLNLVEQLKLETALKQSAIEENTELKEKIKKLMNEITELKGNKSESKSTILKQKNEKILKLQREKAELEIEFISLKQKLDSIEKTLNEEEKTFKNIQTLRINAQEIKLKWDEQKPVEANFYSNYNKLDPTLNKFITVEKNIRHVNKLFITINQEIKKNIETYERKIVNYLQKIDEEDTKDLTYIENNLKDSVTYL